MIGNTADFGKLLEESINNAGSIGEATLLAKVNAFFERGGAADQLVEVLREKLTCMVCLDVALFPAMTRCKHIFCWFCIRTWWLTNEGCPLCRSASTDLKGLAEINVVVRVVMSKNDKDYLQYRRTEFDAQLLNHIVKRKELEKQLPAWEEIDSEHNYYRL